MPFSREQMRREDLTAGEAISKYKKALIRREFPTQYLHLKIDEIDAAYRRKERYAKKARKLLFKQEYDK